MNEHATNSSAGLVGGFFSNDASTFRVTSKGVAILAVLFALEVAALWQLLPW
jgi:hypothetical protein